MICYARLASTVVLDLFDQIDKLSYSIDLNNEFWQAINFSMDFEVLDFDFLIHVLRASGQTRHWADPYVFYHTKLAICF